MKILVLNSGSSSIKCQYYLDQKSIASLLVERIGEKESYAQIIHKNTKEEVYCSVENHHQALNTILSLLKESKILTSIGELDAVGHRVVHGGEVFKAPTLIDDKVIETIRSLIPLAPLHNPENLEAIEILHKNYPDLPQVAVFDTAFHQSMPEYSYLYPLPYALSKAENIRRYGFHGTSHAYVAKEAASIMKKPLDALNLITLHLGNGASVTAIESGKSIDTSMGMTPLEGVMMGTRCGDIDAAIIPFLMQQKEMDITTIDKMMNKESGLKGICGSNDMREVLKQTEQNDPLSQLALEMYTYRIKKYIGAYTVALGRVDAIIFTGGIGEHASKVRELVCKGLDQSIGLYIDSEKNRLPFSENISIHKKESKIQLFIIATNEELEIVLQTQKVIDSK